jgi:hypothetical protein
MTFGTLVIPFLRTGVPFGIARATGLLPIAGLVP